MPAKLVSPLGFSPAGDAAGGAGLSVNGPRWRFDSGIGCAVLGMIEKELG
jgi:hypothetical protein